MRCWSIAVAAAALVALAIPSMSEEPVARAPKIGVVRLQSVLEGLKEKLDVDAQLEIKAQEAQDQLGALKEEASKLEQELTWAKTDEERKKKEDELKDKQRELQAQYKVQASAFRTDKLRATRKLYDKIVAEVEQYGRDHAFDLIIRGSENSDKEIDDPMELNLRIVERVVLYAPAQQDLSDEIAALLNARYQKEKSGAPGTEGAPPAAN